MAAVISPVDPQEGSRFHEPPIAPAPVDTLRGAIGDNAVMRLAFIGAPGVGKTTTAQLVAQRLGLSYLGERSRLVAREWNLTPATIPSERLMEYQWEILVRQIEIEDAHHEAGFVSDRCVVDTLAHLFHFAQHLPLEAAEIQRHLAHAQNRLPHYDMLIFFPPMFPIVDDGERRADPAFQSAMNVHIRDLFQLLDQEHCPGLKARVHTVTSLGIQERVEEILRACRASDRWPAFAREER